MTKFINIVSCILILSSSKNVQPISDATSQWYLDHYHSTTGALSAVTRPSVMPGRSLSKFASGAVGQLCRTIGLSPPPIVVASRTFAFLMSPLVNMTGKLHCIDLYKILVEHTTEIPVI